VILLLTALFACEKKVDATSAEAEGTTETTIEVTPVTKESSNTNNIKTVSNESTDDQTSTKNTDASTDEVSTFEEETTLNKETTAE
jgi:hypothetical protein